MDKNVLSTVNHGPSGPMGPVKANTCAYSLLRKALLANSTTKATSTDKKEKVAESASNTIVGTVSVAPKVNSPRPVVPEETPKVENRQEPVQQQHEYQQSNRKLKPQKRDNNNNQENKQQG